VVDQVDQVEILEEQEFVELVILEELVYQQAQTLQLEVVVEQELLEVVEQDLKVV
jgi:hypothetical protein